MGIFDIDIVKSRKYRIYIVIISIGDIDAFLKGNIFLISR